MLDAAYEEEAQRREGKQSENALPSPAHALSCIIFSA